MNDPLPSPPPDAAPNARHETTDVNPAVVSLSALGFLSALGIILVSLTAVFSRFQTAVLRKNPPSNPLFQEQVPPQPRLQSDPAAEYAGWRDEQEAKRLSYGWIDRQSGIVHIPVDRAMQILAERGFPEPADTPQPPTENET